MRRYLRLRQRTFAPTPWQAARSYLALPRLYDRVLDLASKERGMERWSERLKRR